jgi:uncharacterized protein YpmS
MHTTPVGNRLRSWALVLVCVLALAFLWHQVFAMTGVLWWNAPTAAKRVPRPRPPHIAQATTDWVDLDTYLRNHPTWQP